MAGRRPGHPRFGRIWRRRCPGQARAWRL